MNNDKHPIDDLFQRGLNQHAVPPPMHIWERIEESRGNHHRSKLVFLRQRFSIVSSAAAVLLLAGWLVWQEAPDLGSFPLVTSLGKQTAGLEPPPEESLELPAQRAGLLPDVRSILKNKNKQNQSKAPVSAAPPTAGSSTQTNSKGIVSSTVPAQPVAEETSVVKSPVINEAPAAAPVAPLVRLENTPTKNLPTPFHSLDLAPMPIPETGCARFSEGRPAIFFALTAGPSLPGRTFAARSEEYLDYARQRTGTEATRLSYGAAARLSVVFPWGGAIRSGVGYTQLNEQLVYRNSKVRQTTITEIYGPNGEVIGTDTTYITENTILKYNNRHRMIDIPFQLGYEVRYNKITLAANVGVNLNVAYANRGSYLGPRDLLPTRFDSDDPNAAPVYKTKLGLGWQAGLGLHYQLNDRLDLMAEPYFRYYPESFTVGDYPVSQKYLVGGIGFGMRVLL